MGHTRTMGRRKIDIAYLTDDRKRKGGLFKKADDLSKLCGVEVAVVIIGDKKTCEYASTEMNRILERYQSMQAGVVRDDTSEIARLWTQLETQRRTNIQCCCHSKWPRCRSRDWPRRRY